MDKVKTRYVPGDVLEAFRKAAGRIERFALRLIGLSQLNPADVVRVSLLSMEEYEAARDIVPKLDGWWWLRSPGCFSFNSARVHVVGSVNGNGIIVDEGAVSVRPALRLNPETCHLSIGDRFLAAGHTWTVIPGGLALCDGSIGEHCFREDWEAPDANDYVASDVKQYIEKWARENGLPT